MSGNISFPGQDRMDNILKVHTLSETWAGALELWQH
jgi:hypothetical protein